MDDDEVLPYESEICDFWIKITEELHRLLDGISDEDLERLRSRWEKMSFKHPHVAMSFGMYALIKDMIEHNMVFQLCGEMLDTESNVSLSELAERRRKRISSGEN